MHRAVLADRVEHHRPLALGDGLAQDVDALGLEPLQVGQRIVVTRRPPGRSRIDGVGELGRQISTSGSHGSGWL